VNVGELSVDKVKKLILVHKNRVDLFTTHQTKTCVASGCGQKLVVGKFKAKSKSAPRKKKP
jgi:hypothetical protein